MDVNLQKSELDTERGLGMSLTRTPQLLASHHRVTGHPERAGTAGLTAPTPVPHGSTTHRALLLALRDLLPDPPWGLSQRPAPVRNLSLTPGPAPSQLHAAPPGPVTGRAGAFLSPPFLRASPGPSIAASPSGSPPEPRGRPPATPGPRRPSPARGPPQRRPLCACAAPPPRRSRRPAVRLRSAAACPPLMAGGRGAVSQRCRLKGEGGKTLRVRL